MGLNIMAITSYASNIFVVLMYITGFILFLCFFAFFLSSVTDICL
jgi:hypothetical protein